MKVLWFEISMPSKFKQSGRVVAGWQDALEGIVRECGDIELYVAFESGVEEKEQVIDEVTYIPMFTRYSFLERKKSGFTWTVNEEKTIMQGMKVIEKIKPDIIHVFGNEWPFGLLARYTDIPLVIHIQGSIIPYNNALYPPGYCELNSYIYAGMNIVEQWRLLKKRYKDGTRLDMENRIWGVVNHYMGRTAWDRALVNMLRPDATYHHVEEALRPVFLSTNKRWSLPSAGKLRLVTTGCSSHWKGMDMLLKTAHVLKSANVDFEWNVAGNMPVSLKQIIERKEKLKFSENNINILGFTSPENLIELLCGCTMYVHTAYIENSPNSICEAQVLGVPVVSTMVGGISSLVRGGQDGVLLPANDPWQMANAIVTLSKDTETMLTYSRNTMDFARKRHSPDNILRQLLKCYVDIVSSK